MSNTQPVRTIGKVSERGCAVCGHDRCAVLHRQQFVLPEGHPLRTGYDVVSCDQCGFVFADTAVTQEQYDEFYAKFSKYEDKKLSTGGGIASWDAERFRETVDTILEFLPNIESSILDIGCANGGMLRAFKEIGYNNLYGIDPSQRCVANTLQLGVEAHVGSLASLQKMNREFDCVILSHVLEHVSEVSRAVEQIKRVMRTNGVCYIEVPDASRYGEHVTSPFQDFNTEHINHFSHGSLRNTLGAAGLSELSWGQKTILSSPMMPYPALYAVSIWRNLIAEVFRLTKDNDLQKKMNLYILKSRRMMEAIDAHLGSVFYPGAEAIVWGTGQLTYKLLSETYISKLRIVAFIDGNPINCGKRLVGVPIIGPDQIRGMSQPIIVASIIHYRSIVETIQTELGLPNIIVGVLPEGSVD